MVCGVLMTTELRPVHLSVVLAQARPRARTAETRPDWDYSRPTPVDIFRSLMLPKTAVVCEVRNRGFHGLGISVL